MAPAFETNEYITFSTKRVAAGEVTLVFVRLPQRGQSALKLSYCTATVLVSHALFCALAIANWCTASGESETPPPWKGARGRVRRVENAGGKCGGSLREVKRLERGGGIPSSVVPLGSYRRYRYTGSKESSGRDVKLFDDVIVHLYGVVLVKKVHPVTCTILALRRRDCATHVISTSAIL